jgi:hypothetical protein
MRDPNDKFLKIQKIPLFALLEILDKLYEDGVEYIDITGEVRDDKDVIKILVKEEYMSEDTEEDEDAAEIKDTFSRNTQDNEPNIDFNKRLTEDDIQNLL